MYTIIVGNLGQVGTCSKEKDARKTFDKYVGMSKDGYGRVSGEEVTVIETTTHPYLTDEIVAHYEGTLGEE